jgi:hypothetical protein
MDAAYIEALNTGFLRERESKGDIRDPLLLDEVDLLNETTPPVPSVETDPAPEAPAITTTIPPPSWKRA